MFISWKSRLVKLFVLSLAFFGLSFSCTLADGIENSLTNSVKNSIKNFTDAIGVPTDATGRPACATDDCHDLLAGWYESPDGYFIHFSKKDAEVTPFPPCTLDVTDPRHTFPYTLSADGEIAIPSGNMTALWRGLNTLEVTDIYHRSGTSYTRQPDLANEVRPPSFAGRACPP